MTAPAALRCVGLVKDFGAVRAVDHVDLDVPAGSLTALLGPSGCGKTTVLRMIAGLETPTAGLIEVHGSVVSDGRRTVAAEMRRIGMVFQDYALFPHLTVAQNVAYGLRRLARRDRRVAVTAALELVELADYANRLPNELSGGQQQRVAIARALAPQPAVLLLDEPFSNLDASMRQSVRADVRRILAEAGTTALFVTHDQEEALSLADRVAVMADGRIHQVDTPTRLYQQPVTAFVARFVGDSDILPAVTARPGLVDTPLGLLDSIGAEPAVEAMIRPEQVDLARDPNGRHRVVDVQFFGHDQLITIQLADGTTVRSRRGPTTVVRVGDTVSVGVDGEVRTFAA